MKLLEILSERNISKLQLALKCEIPSHHLYNAINGKTPFYPKYKKAICNYLGMSERELFGNEVDE
ncbi:MAG: helix-turn-helix transcriptional regulator [Clostridia bacterium]